MDGESDHPKMGIRLAAVLTALVVMIVAGSLSSQHPSSEQIQLSSVMPKLQAIHEDTKNLLQRNSELKAEIQAGINLQKASAQQNQQVNKQKPASEQQQKKAQQPALVPTGGPAPKSAAAGRGVVSPNGSIDYLELEEFNDWVDVNLDYAVKNTRASIEALKEEAQQNNGTIEYSEQAVQDGIEGVRYWRSAVLFQDKTLKHEKFDVEE